MFLGTTQLNQLLIDLNLNLHKFDNVKDIIIIGGMAKHPYLKEVIKKLEKLHDVNYIIPENPEFICALGAIENYKKVGANSIDK